MSASPATLYDFALDLGGYAVRMAASVMVRHGPHGKPSSWPSSSWPSFVLQTIDGKLHAGILAELLQTVGHSDWLV